MTWKIDQKKKVNKLQQFDAKNPGILGRPGWARKTWLACRPSFPVPSFPIPSPTLLTGKQEPYSALPAPLHSPTHLAGMQAVQELGEREHLAAVQVGCAKHLLKLRVEQRAAIPQVHDLEGRGMRGEPVLNLWMLPY